jgi:citrate lyase beta subunit
LEAEDLAAVLPHRPDGIVIPKVERGEQVAWVSEQIAAAERAHGWPPGSIRLIAIIESALGVVNLREIAEGHPRLDALVFGAEDFAANVGATRTRAGWEVFYARSAVVTHAAAFGLQAIDMVYVNYKDTVNLKIEALQGAQMGFSGKQIIHPNQVAPVQEAFTPKEEEIAYARRVVEAFEAAQSEGAGAFGLDGVMIDMPLVKAARNVLERARAAGKLPE